MQQQETTLSLGWVGDATDEELLKPNDQSNFDPEEDDSVVVYVFLAFVVFIIVSDLDVAKEDVKEKYVFKNGVYHGS